MSERNTVSQVMIALARLEAAIESLTTVTKEEVGKEHVETLLLLLFLQLVPRFSKRFLLTSSSSAWKVNQTSKQVHDRAHLTNTISSRNLGGTLTKTAFPEEGKRSAADLETHVHWQPRVSLPWWYCYLSHALQGITV